MILVQAIFVIINIVMAAYHAELIEDNKPISHGWWAAGYIVAALIATYLKGEWLLLPILLVLRKPIFDLTLNLFRGYDLWYVSATSGSILDRINNKIFNTVNDRNVQIMYATYTALWIGLNIIYFLKK